MLSFHRLTIAALGLGFLGMSFEAYVSHGMATGDGEPVQWVPVIFGMVAAFVTFIWPVRVARPAVFMLVGVAAVAVGVLGTVAHLEPVVEELSSFEPGTIWTALTATDVPPLAPGAFAVLGLALFILGGNWAELRWRGR